MSLENLPRKAAKPVPTQTAMALAGATMTQV